MTDTGQNYIPSVQQVADVLQVRTRNKFGVMLKTFSSETTPSDLDVKRMAQDATTFVADYIGDTVPDSLIDDAQHLAAIRTAMMIELSYFSDQISSNRSPYPYLKELYDEELARVKLAVDEGGAGDIVGDKDSPYVSFSFPPTSDWLTKRM